MVAGPGGRDHPGIFGAQHRVRPVQPTGKGFLTGTIDTTATFEAATSATAFRGSPPAPRNSQDLWIGVSRDLLITTL
jgi:hypothetical protein